MYRPRILYQVAIKSMAMWRRGLTTLQLLRVKIQALMKTYIMFIVKSHQLSIMHNAPMMSPDSSSTAMLRTSLTVRSVNHKINGLTSTVKLELPRTFARSKSCAAKTGASSVSEAVKANLKRKTRKSTLSPKKSSKSPQRSIIKQSSSSLQRGSIKQNNSLQKKNPLARLDRCTMRLVVLCARLKLNR